MVHSERLVLFFIAADYISTFCMFSQVVALSLQRGWLNLQQGSLGQSSKVFFASVPSWVVEAFPQLIG